MPASGAALFLNAQRCDAGTKKHRRDALSGAAEGFSNLPRLFLLAQLKQAENDGADKNKHGANGKRIQSQGKVHVSAPCESQASLAVTRAGPKGTRARRGRIPPHNSN
jgi:hypothetical protein